MSRDELSSSQTTNSIAVATPSSFESAVCTDTPNWTDKNNVTVNVTCKLMLECLIDAWFGVTRVPRSITLLVYPWVWLMIIVVFVLVVPILLQMMKMTKMKLWCSKRSSFACTEMFSLLYLGLSSGFF